MGEWSGIQWCDSTLNIAAGCDGCELWRSARRDELSPTGYEIGASRRPSGEWWMRICYAGVDTDNKTAKNATRPGGPLPGWPPSFDQPTIFPDRAKWLTKWSDLTGAKRTGDSKGRFIKGWLDGLPRIIFHGDMGDYWTESLDLHWFAPYLPAVAGASHRQLFLTKRPARAATFWNTHGLPLNCWVGTSITSPQDQRLRALTRIKSDRLFVSYEPMLGDAAEAITRFPQIRWWIFGGASGSSSPTPSDPRIIERGLDACRKTGASAFVKQLGSLVFEGEFDSFSTWVNKARSWIGGTDAQCYDAKGRRCPTGAEFMRARDEGTFPVRYAFPEASKGGDWRGWPEHLRVREMPR